MNENKLQWKHDWTRNPNPNPSLRFLALYTPQKATKSDKSGLNKEPNKDQYTPKKKKTTESHKKVLTKNQIIKTPKSNLKP